VLEECLKEQDRKLSDVSVAVQGFGNVGSNAARLLAAQGARIVAVSDITGALYAEAGLDVPAVIEWVGEKGGVAGFAGAQALDGAALLACKVDVLIPAAMEDAITEANVEDVQAGIIVEAANGPISPAAHKNLIERGVIVIPDILANAGGVTVSYFEWTQNIQQFRWELDRVNEELAKVMRKAYADVARVAADGNIDMRCAAFVLAIRRLARAAVSRRHISAGLPSSLLD
jgi:glutamate dehydrogenase/leucine dehydrogenase